jgi:hypothetical protein
MKTILILRIALPLAPLIPLHLGRAWGMALGCVL